MFGSVETESIKRILYGFNVFFALCGLATIVVGSLILTGDVGVDNDALDSTGFAITFIVMGGLLLIEAFVGCSGTMNESVMLLRIFCLAMVAVCILQLVANILVSIGMSDSKVKERLQWTMDDYNSTSDAQDYWDKTQDNFKCCGIETPQDWESKELALPRSCCQKNYDLGITEENESCKQFGKRFKYIRKNGCQDQMLASKDYFLTVIRATTSTLCFLEVVAILIALWLVVRIKQEEMY